jgi:S1-C subfamily serine protease
MSHLVALAFLFAPAWLGMGYTWAAAPRGHHVLHVQRVAPDGPSARAGLRAGDIIVTVNGRAVDFGDELDLLLYLGDRKAGESIVFGIVRDGRRSNLTVKAGAMSENAQAAWKRNLDVARQKRIAAAEKHD